MDPKKATAVISENAHLILDIDSNLDTSLFDLSSIAKSTTDLSNEWIKNIYPKIILVSSEIVDYDPTFQSTYQQLIEMAKAGKTTDLMQQLLAILVATFEDKSSGASNIEVTMKKFSDNFRVQYERIPATINMIDQSIIKLNQDILDLQKELDSLEGMLHRDEIIRKIDELKGKVGLLTGVGDPLRALQKAITDIVQAVVAVSDGWAVLNNGLNQDIDRLKQITTGQPGIVVEVELQAVNKDWEVIMQQAKDLNPAN